MLLSLTVGPALSGTPTVLLTATPTTIEADGRGLSIITAEVRGSNGELIRDPVNVRFTSSLGSIDAVATASGGLARATLRSGTIPGTALVTALMEEQPAVARIQVEFVTVGADLAKETFFTVACDKYLAYSAEQSTIDAVGGARITCRGLTITADEAQVDVGGNTLRSLQKGAQSEIRLTRGDKSFSCSALSFSLSAMRGTAVVHTEGRAEQMSISGWDLRTSKPERERPESDFEIVPLGESGVFIKARSIAVRMGQEVQFKRAVVYADGEKALSVPFYTVPLDGSDAGVSRYVSYGTSGLAVDLPLYYQLEPRNSGSLRIRHNQQGGWGWYATQPGWSLDLEQQYFTQGGSSGKFGLSRLTQQDWGAHWVQDSQFNSTARGHFYFDIQRNSNLYARSSLTKSFKSSSVNLDIYGSKYRGSDATGRADLYWRTNSKPLGRSLRYAVAARSSFDVLSSGSSGKSFAQGLQLQLYSNPFRIGRSGNLTGSVSVGHDWGGYRSGATMLGYMSYSQRLSRTAGMSLSYSYADQPGFTNSAHHRLAATFFADSGSKWHASLYANYGLDYRSVSSFGDLSYSFTRNWSLGIGATYSSFPGGHGNFDYSDLEIAIGRSLGRALQNQELALVWSKSQSKLRVEIRTSRF